MKKLILAFIVVVSFFSANIFSQSKKSQTKTKSAVAIRDTNTVSYSHLVTFIELGSVRCIPCKAMQPVMKSIEEKYGNQIKVVFYDVWKQEQAHYAQEYKIRLIPTQVFIDVNGKELMRHEGFFPEKEIDAFLRAKGLKPKTTDKG